MRSALTCSVVCGALLSAGHASMGVAAPPTALSQDESAAVIRFPHDADLWDAALSEDGRLHVVYSVRQAGESKRGASDLFYLATKNAERTRWMDPRKIPTGELPVTVGGERKALIAVMPRDVVLVSWPSGGLIGAARSADNGGSWVPVTPRDPSAAGHADTMTMTGSAAGRVAFAWTDTAVMGRGEDKIAAPLHVTLSRNGGATYESVIEINKNLLGACVCCTPDLAFDGAGNLWVAYRTSEANIKEICIARLGVDGAITAAIASADEWHLNGCPMNGPEIAVDREGKTVAVTWTREEVIRGATSTDGGKTFGAARDSGRGAHHSSAAGGDRLWLAWELHNETSLIRAIERSGEQRAAVPPTAVLLVSAEGQPLLVSAAGSSTPPGGEHDRHERHGDH